ncbi:periplasmic heavy metal sensor [Croceicoccus mobilis]|uniref:Heavy metal resistance protein n=1 Tax=Croceicoccus mobilis TaxID=1703339 RepID=A0A916YTK9_9SPHN|nr:periplasmic heavy metal sensor [Croceicoccus mobilis]GGD60882.1 hypothetical protein GCM10010990_07970 [Croceicoccus mobilis]
MKFGPLQLLMALVLAIAAGCLGAFAASEWREPAKAQTLHAYVQEEFDLDAEQQARLDALHADFAVERKQMELALRAANSRLAAAMDEEKEYGPKVAMAIDEVHASMGDLQKATVRHVFAMRALLHADQQRLFDRRVAASLTSEPDE